MHSNTVIETLAARLRGDDPARETAFLVDAAGAVYFARAARPRPGVPHSAVTRLLQGVHSLDPSITLRLARRRVYSTAPLSPMCWGMIRVAGTKHASPIAAVDHGVAIPEARTELAGVECGPAPRLELPSSVESDAQGIELALRLAAHVDRSGPRFASDRPVGALLVSAEGRLLAHALNSTTRNRTLHAELKLIQDWHARTGQGLPRDARLYTSLKPCRMCAGMIWHCAEELARLKIVYSEFDHGPNARETVLNARSPDRRRALELGSPSPVGLDAELETRL